MIVSEERSEWFLEGVYRVARLEARVGLLHLASGMNVCPLSTTLEIAVYPKKASFGAGLTDCSHMASRLCHQLYVTASCRVGAEVPKGVRLDVPFPFCCGQRAVLYFEAKPYDRR